MFGNYLGIGRSNKNGDGPKYSRTQPRATPSTRCQKCQKLGHFTYECTGQREYKVRPTRTQILNNPKLRTKVTGQVQALPAPSTELLPKEGTAAAILAANEAKRQAKAAKLAEKRRRSRSMSSSSGSSSSGGQIPSTLKPDGTQQLLEGSVAEKTASCRKSRLVIENLEKVLKAGGSSLQQLVKINIFITSFDLFKEMNDEYVKLIPDPKPARTCVQVAGLPFGAQIEIEAIGWAE
ncbi:hypothetical protein OIV83_004223 [Microbotryomycetes sp. JL201]|nr:hypothetical protein OIV83_004223 [Microbotryomycetes sp. JL201]